MIMMEVLHGIYQQKEFNSDLANVLGNLVNRTIAMSNKYFGGIVENKNVCEDVDQELKDLALAMPAKSIAKNG